MESHWMDPRTGVPSPALMQAGARRSRTFPEWEGSNSVEPQLYLCLHSFCEYRHPDEGALDRHVKTHFTNPAIAYDAVAKGSTTPKAWYGPTFLRDGYNHGGHLLPDDEYGYERPLLPQTECGYGIPSRMTSHPAHVQQLFNSSAATVYASPGPAGSAAQIANHALAPLILGIASPAATSTISGHPTAAPATLGITTPTPTPTTSIPLTPTLDPTAPLRHACPTCTRTFTRPSDLARHALKHDPLARRYECTFPGCKYVGSMGFTRKDKLASHVRARHGG